MPIPSRLLIAIRSVAWQTWSNAWVPRYFTVDRLGTLIPGTVVELTHFNDIDPPDFQRHADRYFPDGFSKFGERYFVAPWTGPQLESTIELVWEQTRRSIAPEAPSRFVSMFAVATESDAWEIRARLGGTGRIVEVEASDGFRADMNLLVHRPDSIIVMSYMAELYWTGQERPGMPPAWEFLLQSPVRVVMVCA